MDTKNSGTKCCSVFYFPFFLIRSPFEWSEQHDDLLLREVLVVEPFKYKPGSPRRGQAWTQIADILNSIEEPKFRVNQRAVRDRYNLLEKGFKKKISEEERASGINPPELTDLELAIQEIIEKSCNAANEYTQCNTDNEKQKAEEMRRKSLETFSETKARLDCSDDDIPKAKKSRGSGSETMAFLSKKAESDLELRREELRLKHEELAQQKEERQNQTLMLNQQQNTLSTLVQQMTQQQAASQQQQQNLMLAFMQSQQQQTELFTAMMKKFTG